MEVEANGYEADGHDWVGIGAAKKTTHSNISILNSRKALSS